MQKTVLFTDLVSWWGTLWCYEPQNNTRVICYARAATRGPLHEGVNQAESCGIVGKGVVATGQNYLPTFRQLLPGVGNPTTGFRKGEVSNPNPT